MSRAEVVASDLPQVDDKHGVRCLFLSQKNTTLLLPNTVVTEVTDYTPPETTQHSPDWLLGLLSWRGRNIPLVSFENLFGEPSVEKEPRHVAVLNSLSGNVDVPFFAITISSMPRLVIADENTAEYIGDDSEDDPEAILARMNVAGELVIIPNLDFIEERIVQLGIQ